VQLQRRRQEIGKAAALCGLCGSDNVVVVESRVLRRGLNLINPAFRRHARRYDLCRSCGAKHGDE
jgi:transposase